MLGGIKLPEPGSQGALGMAPPDEVGPDGDLELRSINLTVSSQSGIRPSTPRQLEDFLS